MPLPTSPATGIFPLYLIPSNPFRRRSEPATRTTASTIIDASTSSSLPSPPSYLSGSSSILQCNRCLAHICPTTSIISKGFNGRFGRAFLVSPPPHSLGTLTPPDEYEAAPPRHHQAGNLPNTHVHKPQPRNLVTGAHVVSDISCVACGQGLGWKYVDAEEESQKYKVGNFILEMKRVVKGVDWENGDQVFESARPKRVEKHARKDSGVSMDFDDVQEVEDGDGREVVEFDSEDEDECEDLFMGIWTPALAKKRRRARVWRDEKDIV